jgi:hypothetical protein
MRNILFVLVLAGCMSVSIFAFGQWSGSKVVHSNDGGETNKVPIFTAYPNTRTIEDSGYTIQNIIDASAGTAATNLHQLWSWDATFKLTTNPYIISTNDVGLWVLNSDGSVSPSAGSSDDIFWSLTNNMITPR